MPRCFYEVLGVPQSINPEELRAAYRKQALQWHPDKNQENVEEATLRFKEIQNAYEVLSDRNERAWYDSHRESILRSDQGYYGAESADHNSEKPEDINLWSFFSSSVFSGYNEGEKGFYSVYSHLFQSIHKQEQQAAWRMGKESPPSPEFGDPGSPFTVVSSFYSYWTNFVTVKDFAWCDEFNLAAAPSRKVRRLMEEENGKIRKKEKKEFNDTVRQLALFVKKRDKRVMEHQLAVLQKKKEQEEIQRKKKAEAAMEKAMRASKKKEQEEEDDGEEELWEYEDEWETLDTRRKKKNMSGGSEESEYLCVACNKVFKSEKQWKNHEKSRKHLGNIAHLKESLLEEEHEVEGAVDEVGREEGGSLENGESCAESKTPPQGNSIQEMEADEGNFGEDSANIELSPDSIEEEEDVDEEDDDEAMLSRMLNTHCLNQKIHRKANGKEEIRRDEVEKVECSGNESSETKGNNPQSSFSESKEFGLEENNLNDGLNKEVMEPEDWEIVDQPEGLSGPETCKAEELLKEESQHGAENGEAGKMGQDDTEAWDMSQDEKRIFRKSLKGKKGRKGKVDTVLLCKVCSTEFESRNQLYKHIASTGHAVPRK